MTICAYNNSLYQQIGNTDGINSNLIRFFLIQYRKVKIVARNVKTISS